MWLLRGKFVAYNLDQFVSLGFMEEGKALVGMTPDGVKVVLAVGQARTIGSLRTEILIAKCKGKTHFNIEEPFYRFEEPF